MSSKWMVLVVALVGFGCSSGPKDSKNDAAAKATSKAQDSATKGKPSKATPATTDAAAGNSKVACSIKGDDRTIEVRPDGNGCQVAYNKGGQESIVATAQNGTAHCQATLNKIKGNLENAGYACK